MFSFLSLNNSKMTEALHSIEKEMKEKLSVSSLLPVNGQLRKTLEMCGSSVFKEVKCVQNQY